MTAKDLSTDSDFEQAAELAADGHARLRRELPFLPARAPEDYLPRIRWIAEKGVTIAFEDGGRVMAFMGGFVIEDFRNAGPGAYCPDWCHGVREGDDPGRTYPRLYAAIAPRWIEAGARIHAIALYSTEREALESLSLTGFGRIVMDAAAPTDRVLAATAEPDPRTCGVSVRAAGLADVEALATMDAVLAAHIAAPPVLMPGAQGQDADEWRAWFAGKDAAAFIAEDGDGRPLGFIKAEEPQFDVSHAVQSSSTLAIDGMFVVPGARGAGLGRLLLSNLARRAADNGKTLMSVDCETMNPEAIGFWPRFFSPVGWSLERRV